MAEEYYFEPSARLQRLLSRELISDPNLAVVELVKNAYDAGATEVIVGLTTGSAPVPSHRLVIADNGSGMSPDEFRDNWMRPGYSEKARDPGKPIDVNGSARTPVGEKGLGRLAAGRLGERLTVYTRKDTNEQWFRIVVDWRQFDDMDQAMTDVKLLGELIDSAPLEAYESGTVLVIEDMTVDLTAKIPGRKVAGRADTRFGRLAQDLRLLVTRVGTVESSPFSILLNVDVLELAGYTGTFEIVDALVEGQFLYEFTIAVDETQQLVISRTVNQGDSNGDSVEKILDSKGSLVEVGEVARVPHGADLDCGPIQGVFSYAPPIRGQRLTTSVPAGVFLYRDGVRVEPYGEIDADWLGAYSRKASRQGYAPIQPKYLFGSVHIGRRSNPHLVDMSNRQGLIDNRAFASLSNHVRAEFAFFEQVVQDHRQTPRWEKSQAKKRQDAAQQRVQASKVQSRALAHAIRQPLTGLGAELFILGQVLRDDRLPSDIRAQLEDLNLRLRHAAADISERVQTFLQAGDQEVRDFKLEELFAEVVARVGSVAFAHKADIEFDSGSADVSFAYGVLLEAIVELLTNAISAEAVTDRARRVTVTSQVDEGLLRIRIADNAAGLPQARASNPFEVGMSVSGRPGHGLVMQKLNLVGAGGDVKLTQTSEVGTEFQITIPTASSTVNIK